MNRWHDFESQAPDLAALTHRFLDAHVHKTIATLRRDGSPRISGVQASLVGDDLWLGMMPGSLKALDLRRDPRFALHSGSDDPPAWQGDAKISGRAVEIGDTSEGREARRAIGAGEGDSHLFRVDVEEVAVVRLGDPADHLIIETWHHERGLMPPRRR